MTPRCPDENDSMPDEVIRCNLVAGHDGLHKYGRGIAWYRPKTTPQIPTNPATDSTRNEDTAP